MSECRLPPSGWYCIREPGHEGPCAAYPINIEDAKNALRPSDEFNFEQFQVDLTVPPSDIWLRHLAANQQIIGDFQKYLDVNLLRAQAHMANLKGPEMRDDLLRLQGGVRSLATIRLFVATFLKNTGDK